jgi:hypothetical protein
MAYTNTMQQQGANKAHTELAWHQDCLACTVILASAMGPKTMKKLLVDAGYDHVSAWERPEAILETMHVVCHHDERIVAAVSKSLNKRYRSALTSVKGMQPNEVDEKASSLTLPVPLLWACFQADDPPLRAQGRRLAHLILWNAIKRLLEQPRIDSQAEQLGKLRRANANLRKEISELRKTTLLTQSPKVKARPAPAAESAPRLAQPDIASLKKTIKLLERQLQAETRQKEQLHQEAAVWRALALNREKEDTYQPGFNVGGLQTHIPTTPGAAGDEPPPCAAARSCEQCPLQGVKVAVIGGLKRMETNYCDVVDRLGGQCLCHPGHVASGCRRLRQVVGKADLVVFITTINSHSAMSAVKSECKKHGKPFLAMDRTGAGSLEKMLLGAAA